MYPEGQHACWISLAGLLRSSDWLLLTFSRLTKLPILFVRVKSWGWHSRSTAVTVIVIVRSGLSSAIYPISLLCNSLALQTPELSCHNMLCRVFFFSKVKLCRCVCIFVIILKIRKTTLITRDPSLIGTSGRPPCLFFLSQTREVAIFVTVNCLNLMAYFITDPCQGRTTCEDCETVPDCLWANCANGECLSVDLVYFTKDIVWAYFLVHGRIIYGDWWWL